MLYQSRLRTTIRRTTLVLVFTFICGAQVLAVAGNTNSTETARATTLDIPPGELVDSRNQRLPRPLRPALPCRLQQMERSLIKDGSMVSPVL